LFVYIIRRFFFMIVLMVAMSIFSFIVIQLPPGDYLTSYIVQLESTGARVTDAQVEALKRQYGLDLPFHQRYLKWTGGMLRGDFGLSYQWNRPIADLIKERLPLSVAISLVTVMFTYTIAIPIGVYAATHPNTAGDYILTVLGFAGMAMPNFLLALIAMFLLYKYFGFAVTGLFSPEFQDAPWSFARFVDLLKNMWMPVVVVGVAGIARVIRVMRACLLDELQKPYVETARTKGLSERRLLWKYPVRVALNPIISTIGWLLPWVISGETITAIVLNLPTVGPLLLQALVNQDTYLAGTLTMLLTFMTLVGMFLSDILLVWADPRIRLD